jgi:2-aminoadipate transaminase
MEHLLSARARGARSSVIRELLRLTEQPGVLSLAGGLPAPELFPTERVRAAFETVLGARALQYAATEGAVELRAIAARRFPACTVDEVLVTTGSQQALDLIARCLLDPGDAVVVESPSYLGALQAFSAAGGRCVGIPGDADGLRVDVLADHLAAGLRPKLAYVVTDFANPSGATLSTERRRALATLSDRYGFVIVEDDPYGELRWAGRRPAPLRDMGSQVVSLGSASKVLVPGLRVGWMAAPSWLMGPLVRTKQAADLHTSTLSQLLVAELLRDDAAQRRHLERLRAEYGTRAAALHAVLPAGLVAERPDGGMFLWAHGEGIDTTALLPRAVDVGVAFVPGSAFFPQPDAASGEWMRLSYATLTVEGLAEAARRLGAAMEATPAGVG